MTRSDCERVVSYLRATENEIAIDEGVYRLCGAKPRDFGYVPRPSKVISKLKGTRIPVASIIVILRFFWAVTGGIFFHGLEFIRFFVYRFRLRPLIASSMNPTNCALAFSARAAEIFSAQVPSASCIVISVPWARIGPSSCRAFTVMDVFGLLSYADLIRALKLSIVATRCMARKRGTAGWALQSYTAFRWMAVRLAMEKMAPERFIIAEHFDRWACLTDDVVRRQRHEKIKAGKARTAFTIIQHGSLVSLDSPDSIQDVDLPFRIVTRLRYVTDLKVYDENSKCVFYKSILSDSCVKKIESVAFYKPAIELVALSTRYPVRLLFVGHPIYEGLHMEIFEFLKSYPVSCFYKPHPSSRASVNIRKHGWEIIADRTSFPVVDFIIAYPSTLVSEYAAKNIPAVVHSLAGGTEAHADVVSEVIAILHTLNVEKI